MNHRPWLWAALLSAPFLLVAPARADAPKKEEAKAKAPKPLSDQTIPAEATDAPDAKAWKEGVAVELDGPLPRGCTARLLREWLRVRCRQRVPGSGSVVSGPAKEVAFYATIPKLAQAPEFLDRSNGMIEMVLPLRAGLSRIVQLTEMDSGGGYGGWVGQSTIVTVVVQWPKGQAKPEVLTTERTWSDEILGMTLGDENAAKAADIETKKRTGDFVIDVKPGSLAEKGDAQKGDLLLGGIHWQDRLAFGNGQRFETMVLRKGTTKLIRLPLRRKKAR